MTWTRHGHHIPGSPTEDELSNPYPARARCGGTSLCIQCKEDFQVYLAGRRVMQNQNNEPDPWETETPVSYEPHLRQTHAIKLSARNAEEAANWTGGEIRYYETEDAKGVAGIVIPTLVAPEFIPVGNYIVQNEKGQFTGVDAAVFQREHMPHGVHTSHAIVDRRQKKAEPSYLDVEDQIRRRAMEEHPSYPNGPLNYGRSSGEQTDSGPNGSWPPGYQPNKPRIGQ